MHMYMQTNKSAIKCLKNLKNGKSWNKKKKCETGQIFISVSKTRKLKQRDIK